MSQEYAMGWRRAALWANRDDLIADIESPAYERDMAADLATLRQQAGRVDFNESDLTALRSLKVGEVLTEEQWEAECQFVRHQDEIIRNLRAALAQNTQGEAVAWAEPDVLESMSPMGGLDGVDAVECIVSKERTEQHTVPLYLHAERARVPEGWVPRAVVEVAQGDLHMLKKAIEARDPWPELLVRVTDTERDLRTALAAAPPQRAEVNECAHSWFTDGINPTRCSKCGRPATERAEVK